MTKENDIRFSLGLLKSFLRYAVLCYGCAVLCEKQNVYFEIRCRGAHTRTLTPKRTKRSFIALYQLDLIQV